MAKSKKSKTPFLGSLVAEITHLATEYPEMTNAEIARDLACSVGYVYKVRSKMDAPTLIPEDVREAEAEAITEILEERGLRYGPFTDHAAVTQKLKAVAHRFAAEKGKTFGADQAEALDMIFHKIGRILNGDPDYADSWIDIAGYAKLVADRLQGTVR